MADRETPANVQTDIKDRADQTQRYGKNIKLSQNAGRDSTDDQHSCQDSRSLILLSHAWTPPREIQLSSPYFPWYLIYSISSLSLERNLIFCFPYPFFGSGWQENQIFSFQPYPFGGLGWGQKCGNRLNYGCRQCRRRVWALSPMKSL